MFRRITILTALLAFAICAAGAQVTPPSAPTESNWIKVAPPNEGFSVLMPSEPTPEKQSQDSPSGTIEISMWLSNTAQGKYLVGVTVYPADLDVKQELSLDRDNFLKAVNGKLVSETDITQKGNPGKEFTATSDQFTFKSRVYVVGRRRAYMVVAGEPTASFSVDRANKLLQSFELTQ